MTLWIKTTNDKYEFIVAMGDTAKDLAKECGKSENAIYSAISHAKRDGYESIYKRVVVE